MAALRLVTTGMMFIKGNNMNDLDSYAIHVTFFERGYWSKSYTYKSKNPYLIGDIVIVPANDFYAVGKVTGAEKGYNFKENINYKFVIQAIKPK